MTNLDALRKLFQTVFCRPPVGKAASSKVRIATELRLRNRAVNPNPSQRGIRIPDVLLAFHALFGKEPDATMRYYHFCSIDTLIATPSHVIFASDPRFGFSYGMSHHMLEFDDPMVEVVRTEDRDDACEWQTCCESLDDFLVQYASRNLLESMPFDLHVDDTTLPGIREELTEYPTIPLTKSGEGGVRCEPFYAPGTIIVVDPQANTAMIGLDSLDRAISFRAKHDWDFDEVFKAEE